MLSNKILRPDAKGRIALGELAHHVSSFRLSIDNAQRIILEPMTEIPLKEKWLFENKAALKQLQQGIADAADDNTKDLGDFTQYLDEE